MSIVLDDFGSREYIFAGLNGWNQYPQSGSLVNLGKQEFIVPRLAIRTIDFKLAFRLMTELKKRGLRFILLEHDAVLPESDMIWFGGELEVVKYRNEGQPIMTSPHSVKEAVDNAVRLMRGIGHVHQLSFGIDPGPRPGLGWLADGVVLGIAQFEHIENLAAQIIGISSALDFENMVIRIGDGAPLSRDRIINDCLTHQLEIEVVNEAKTSRGLLRHNHVISAIRIAMISGERVWEFRELQPTEGEVREIQRQSRKKSNGRKTISSQMAYAVACGDLTLEEAIER